MPIDLLLLLINFTATWFMAGVIWLIQIVHYPLFANVGSEHFADYEQAHQRLITPVVLPAMVIELATAIALVIYIPAGIPRWWMIVGVALVVLMWLSTFALQVPVHERFSVNGFDPGAHRWLVHSNWIRTVGWTMRAMLMAAALWRVLVR